MGRVPITEYLEVDCDTEKWYCNRCGYELFDARDNYKKGCLIYERPLEEVHPPLATDPTYNFTPHRDFCRLIEFYCPGCGIQIENEYLPPGHPITHEIDLDIDALKARQEDQ